MATTAASATLAAPGDCVVVWGGSSMSSSSRPSKNGVVLSSGLWGKGMASSLSKSSINAGLCHRRSRVVSRSRRRSRTVLVRAAKLPSEVERPKEEPKLQASFWGFTEEAEVWNSRAAMIGIFCLIALEFVIHKGILQIAGVEVGKGLDLPL